MYDPVLAKSFSRYERKKLGLCALILCLISALSIRSTFKPHLHPLSLFGGPVNLQLSINTFQDMLASANETTDCFKPTVGNNSKTLISNKPSAEEKMVAPLCRILNSYTDYCDIEGDIRIEAKSSTIFVVTDQQEKLLNSTNNSWIIQPYARIGMSNVKHWTVKRLFEHKDEHVNIPKCTQNHSVAALLLSTGGYSGNYFHDFVDLLFPLYSTSFRFGNEVQFLASDYKAEWISKYRGILDRLTRHEVVDIDKEKVQVHCYKHLVAGLKFYMEFFIDPSELANPIKPTMQKFRHLLWQTYALRRKSIVKSRKVDGKPPRLMIISRNKTRVLTNEDEVSLVARELGFEVAVADEALSNNMSRFAQEVNSFDVLMGIHGAGLTNMVFLPDNAVLIQVVPFGGIDRYATLDFDIPAARMNIRYLEYKITPNESSLSREYPLDHRVFRDPAYYHRKGWMPMSLIYLYHQNVTIDVERFRGTLVKALKNLRKD